MRTFFMILSRSKVMQWLVAHFGPARLIARRFTSGESLDDALAVVRGLEKKGMRATVNFLGEKVESREDAGKVAEAYMRILQRIHDEGLQATVSVKPTHIGLGLGEKTFHRNLEKILDLAGELGTFGEVDMEDSATTDTTLESIRQLLEKGGPLRVALQANLFRTADDLKAIIERGGSVRLVKGAYDEPARVAWKSMKDVDASYARLIELSFAPKGRESGFYPAFATHDHLLIEKVLSEAASRQFPSDGYEFQMLLGVRRDWQEKLVSQGASIRIYVPFGTHWYPYFMRRLAERPANAALLARALLSR